LSQNEKNLEELQEAPDPGQECAGEDLPEQEQEETPPAPSELELLQQRYDELDDKYLRLLAEYDNFRKRTQREKDEMYRGATAAALEKILPIWDNFQRAMAFDAGSEDFAKGIELIAGSFSETLKGFGLEAYGEVGESFDPKLHYAVSHIEDENLGSNVISQVMQQGYRLGERIIRFAMVQTAN